MDGSSRNAASQTELGDRKSERTIMRPDAFSGWLVIGGSLFHVRRVDHSDVTRLHKSVIVCV